MGNPSRVQSKRAINDDANRNVPNRKIEQCRSCLLFLERIKSIHKNGKDMYFDDSGRPWRGNQCPSCYRKYQTIKNREAGHKPRDLITERKNKKARDAEILAAAYFRNNGFQVDLTSGMGPDLILKKNDLTLTCEVKSTTESKYHPNCFIVAKISPNRMEDDIVAIVLPSGVVHVEPMKSHLSKCQKHGARSVTKLIRRRRWVGAEECSPEDKKIATDRAKLASTKHGRYSKK